MDVLLRGALFGVIPEGSGVLGLFFMKCGNAESVSVSPTRDRRTAVTCYRGMSLNVAQTESLLASSKPGLPLYVCGCARMSVGLMC